MIFSSYNFGMTGTRANAITHATASDWDTSSCESPDCYVLPVPSKQETEEEQHPWICCLERAQGPDPKVLVPQDIAAPAQKIRQQDWMVRALRKT